ncbi:MAG TPA: NAD(P)-dependent oxidoreductase [Ideonella sp.]|nr:NAD(P)-dependent oxidoreductase [Ideonella sp.]
MPAALLITDPIAPEPFVAALRDAAGDLALRVWHPELDLAGCADVEAVLAWRWPRGVLECLPRLRWACALAAGVDKLLVPGLPAAVGVSRIVDPEQALGVAQYVAALALRHLRALPLYEAQQRERRWTRHPVEGALHRCAGVLGQGVIGREVARVLAALGFEVQGWSRSAGVPLADFLPRHDLVVCALPLTAATVGLLDAHAFAAMKRGAYFINIARGGHVVEADLVAALRDGRLAGAALDVQSHEPLPSDDPLWNAPGVTVTPHIAAQSSPATIARQFVEGWRALQAGRPLPRLIDRARGY